MEDTMLSKFKGCFLGLTIGDALGAPVEFLSLTEIKRKYGEDGITDLMPGPDLKPAHTPMIPNYH